jgi:hypothetical protein
MHLPKGDQMQLLSLVALEVADAHPGIGLQENICGGMARVIQTRIPVWLLEATARKRIARLRPTEMIHDRETLF